MPPVGPPNGPPNISPSSSLLRRLPPPSLPPGDTKSYHLILSLNHYSSHTMSESIISFSVTYVSKALHLMSTVDIFDIGETTQTSILLIFCFSSSSRFIILINCILTSPFSIVWLCCSPETETEERKNATLPYLASNRSSPRRRLYPYVSMHTPFVSLLQQTSVMTLILLLEITIKAVSSLFGRGIKNHCFESMVLDDKRRWRI